MRRWLSGLLAITLLMSIAPGALAQTGVCGGASTLAITESGAWSSGAEMPTVRSEIGAAAIEGQIYVLGGLVPEGVTNAFEVYDIEADEWAELAPLPTTLHHMGMAALDGRVYVSGGYEVNFSPNDRAWIYDPESDSWEQIADLPLPRGAHQMAALGDSLYVVGGIGPNAATVMVYDPEADSWSTEVEPLPTLREHLAATADDDLLYVISGRSRGRNLASVEVYDPEDDSWEQLADIPTARSGITAAVVEGQIHVTGGETLDGGSCTFNQHEVYDIESGAWLALPDLPTQRHGLTSVAVEGRWYVIGGATEASSRTLATATGLVEIYTSEIDEEASD